MNSGFLASSNLAVRHHVISVGGLRLVKAVGLDKLVNGRKASIASSLAVFGQLLRPAIKF